jgi:hypothetical protein
MAAAHPATAVSKDAETTRVDLLEGTPGSAMVFVFLGLAIVVVVFVLYTLWKFWPTAAILSAERPTKVHYLWMTKTVSTEVRLFIVVAVSGALGGLLHSTRSFAWYVGHSSLKWRWLPYYIVTLFIGAGLATIVYVVVRGGFISGKSDATANLNPYGFAAIGAIVGLFSEQALEMLRRVATDFFAQAPEGSDTVAPENEADVGTIALPVVSVGTASGVAASTATLMGSLTPGGDSTSYHFEYGTTLDYELTTAEGVLTGTDPVTVSVDLTDLMPATLYHFRLVAANGTDIVNGDDATFTTLAP